MMLLEDYGLGEGFCLEALQRRSVSGGGSLPYSAQRWCGK